jgi:hypothetical protein
MRYLSLIFLIFLSLVFSFSCTPPPDYRDRPEHFLMFEKNRFFIDPLVFFDKDSSKPRLDLYLAIPPENILFKKTGSNGNYESKINIFVTITDSNNEQIIKKNYALSSSFGEDEMKRVSKELKFYFYSYFIGAGKYKLEIKLVDDIAKKEYLKTEDLNVRDFDNQNIAFSDVMLLKNYSVNGNGTKEITPLVTNNVFRLKDVYAFFEVYCKNDSGQTKEYIFKIKNNKGIYIKEETVELNLLYPSSKITQKIISQDEFMKHQPEQMDFEDFSPDDKDFGILRLEIIDKSENKIIATKRFSVLPDKKHFPKKMGDRPGMH